MNEKTNRAILTEDGFKHNDVNIQGSYKFSNIKSIGETNTQSVYSAIMMAPMSVPCLITIVEHEITIATMDNNFIHIKY